MAMTIEEGRRERNRIIGEVYREWAAEQADTFEPDPRYRDNNPSQYPETAEALSAPPNRQDDLQRRTETALREAGLPVVWTREEIEASGLRG
jgi:hypothetical protein